MEPATADTWSTLGRVFGPGTTNPGSCWCQRFPRHDAEDNHSALRQEIEDALVPIGLVAYIADDPVGWTRVVPRHTLPGITGNRALARLLDGDPNAWWITCFLVRREHRGGGVGVALLERGRLGRRARRHRPRRTPGRYRGALANPVPVCCVHRHPGDVPARRVHRNRTHLPQPIRHAT